MKKNGLVISILFVIVLLHAIVLYVCLRSPDKKKTEKEQQIEKEIQKPSNPEQTPQKAPVAAAPEVPTVSPEEYRRQHRKASNAGMPLNYTYAVNGDIPSIPASSMAKGGILVDTTTRNVLWCKNPKVPLRIASMTKIMTVLIAYEDALNNRNGVRLTSPVKISRAASKIGGSQVYLDPRETFTLSELMRAASIQSANDAAYMIGEFIGEGRIEAFIERMNQRAGELGMNSTHFYNSHGLPGTQDNVSSPEDMVKLAEATMCYPLLMEWASTLFSGFREKGQKGYINMKNHNHLIPGGSHHFQGVNGLKTGFIQKSGFCLTVTCNREGHKLIGVMMGFRTWRERDNFAVKLLNWGYARAKDPAAARKKDATVKPTTKTAPSAKKNTKRKKR